MTLTRRNLLLSGAGMGAAWAAAGLAGCGSAKPAAVAAAPAAEAFKVTPITAGVTRVALGGVTVNTLTDGFFARPLDANFVRNAPLDAVQAALRDAGLPTDKVEVPFTPLIADVRGQRIIFDVGNGEFGAATAGKLLQSMAKAGISPDSITAVVFSHFHGDHINGLRNKAGELTFPKAKVFVPAPEWAYWMDDARMAAAPEAMKGAFAAVRRVFGPIAPGLARFEPGNEVLPGVRSIPAFGHTPGHTAFAIEGGSRRVLYWADTTNVAALFVRNPDWAVMFDMDADLARQVRRRLADQAIREKMLLAGYHLPGAAIGELSVRGSGYDFKPLA